MGLERHITKGWPRSVSAWIKPKPSQSHDISWHLVVRSISQTAVAALKGKTSHIPSRHKPRSNRKAIPGSNDTIQISHMHGPWFDFMWFYHIRFQKDLKTCLTDYTSIIPWSRTKLQCLLLRSRCACHSKATISENLVTYDLKPIQLQFRGQLQYYNMFIDSRQHASKSERFQCLPKWPQGMESCNSCVVPLSHTAMALRVPAIHLLTLPWKIHLELKPSRMPASTYKVCTLTTKTKTHAVSTLYLLSPSVLRIWLLVSWLMLAVPILSSLHSEFCVQPIWPQAKCR